MIGTQKEEQFGLSQGQKFIEYQNKIKKTVEQRQGFKESFQNYYNNSIILPTKNMDLSINTINIDEQNKLIAKLKNMETQYQNLLQTYSQTDLSSTTLPQLLVIRDKLTIIGNDIATTMETLYNNNDKIYNYMSMNKEQFKKKINQYRNVSMSLKEGFGNLDPRDVNTLLYDSDVYIKYENYNYVMWSILAIGALSLTYKLLK